jgi:hypothetical protein
MRYEFAALRARSGYMDDEVYLLGVDPIVRILGRRTIVLLHAVVALGVPVGHRVVSMSNFS